MTAEDVTLSESVVALALLTGLQVFFSLLTQGVHHRGRAALHPPEGTQRGVHAEGTAGKTQYSDRMLGLCCGHAAH